MGIKIDFFSLPHNDEVETTLFGTGGGYGEAIVLKINKEEWAIIDSCINPETKYPLTLNYLNKIGVELDKVKFVICTHWHNDHILGLSKVLSACQNAKFCIPRVSDIKQFLRFINMDYKKIERGSIASFNEFKDCLELMKTRKSDVVKRLSSDVVIYSEKLKLSDNSNVDVELFSLSPSDFVVNHFDKEVSKLISDFRLSKKAIGEKSANDKSVVIYFKYSTFSALLGADLEVKADKSLGWRDIDENSAVVKNKSIIYKIPHHGSENGYSENIYNNLVESDAILKMSPWNRSTKLPQPEMIEVYKNHSSNLFITSPINISNKPKKRDKSTEKLIQLFSKKLEEVKFNEGIVRTRHNLLKGKTNVEVHGSAFKI